MSAPVVLFVVMAVALFGGMLTLMGVVLWAIRRSRPGRAGKPRNGQGIPGVVRAVIVSVDARPPARFQDDNDQRRVTVLIDTEGPAGVGRLEDGPHRPKYLPWGMRWQIFTKNPLRYGDLQLQMSDYDERMDATRQARAGGYEFVLDEPVRVVVTDPGGNGRRPRWQVVGE